MSTALRTKHRSTKKPQNKKWDSTTDKTRSSSFGVTSRRIFGRPVIEATAKVASSPNDQATTKPASRPAAVGARHGPAKATQP